MSLLRNLDFKNLKIYEDDILAKANEENNYYPPAEAGGNSKAGNFELPQASACGINNISVFGFSLKIKKIEIETLLI